MAQRDFEEICESLDRYSKNAVLNFKLDISRKIEDLKLSPHMYQCIDKNKNYNLRRIVIKNYIILYIILEKEVEILRILPQKSNYLKSLKQNFKKVNFIQK